MDPSKKKTAKYGPLAQSYLFVTIAVETMGASHLAVYMSAAQYKAMVQRLTLANSTMQFSDVVSDLGVRLDSQLTMASHIAALSRSCFFQLRQMTSIKQSLTIDATNTRLLEVVSTTAIASWLVLVAN